MTSIQQHLWELEDKPYKDFHSKLIPNIPPDRIIGIRTPVLRSYAGKLLRDSRQDTGLQAEIDTFLADLPHQYYDENNLHAFLIEGIRDYGKCLEAVNRFLPYIDNWATCDMMSPKVFARHLDELEEAITAWLASGQTYTVRYAIGMLMRYDLDDRFDVRDLNRVADCCCEEYYINMMAAWYFATALARQYELTLPYIEAQRLPLWTHNKAIQKAVESRRITPEQKAYLRTLKRSNCSDRSARLPR